MGPWVKGNPVNSAQSRAKPLLTIPRVGDAVRVRPKEDYRTEHLPRYSEILEDKRRLQNGQVRGWVADWDEDMSHLSQWQWFNTHLYNHYYGGS